MENYKMQASKTAEIFTIVVATLIILAAGYVAIGNIEDSIDAKIDLIEFPNVVIPEINVPTPLTRLSLREELKTEALSVCDEEFDMDDVEDLFGSDEDVELVREYTDERTFNSGTLGIDNVDDREITIYREYKVRVDDDYSDRVKVTCEVTSDDGELEAELIYTL